MQTYTNRYLLTLGWCIALVTFSSCIKSNQGESEYLSEKDMAFMGEASYVNLGEMQSGNLAVQNSNEADVLNFGVMMMSEHDAAQQELSSVAASFNFILPPDTDQEHKEISLMLAGLRGREFDSTYIYTMVKGHDKAILIYEDEIQNGSNEVVIQHARAKLPAIQNHRSMANSLAHELFP